MPQDITRQPDDTAFDSEEGYRGTDPIYQNHANDTDKPFVVEVQEEDIDAEVPTEPTEPSKDGAGVSSQTSKPTESETQQSKTNEQIAAEATEA